MVARRCSSAAVGLFADQPALRRHRRRRRRLNRSSPSYRSTPQPVATHRFEIDAVHDDVVGQLQVTVVGKEDTLPDIARRFNVGYEEIVRANPGVDPWLPRRRHAKSWCPRSSCCPLAERKGIVVNVAAMRIFYFPPAKAGEKQVVYTHPIGIGKVGWSTPEGTTKVVSKQKDPVWRPTASIRAEHKKNGEILPAVVPAGPDNPLGRYKLTLGWPSYLIHGTNKPYGVGLRSSHGCIRLYPEDIEKLFEMVGPGTQVQRGEPAVRVRLARATSSTCRPTTCSRTTSATGRKSQPKLLAKTLTKRIQDRTEGAQAKRSTGRAWRRSRTIRAGLALSVSTGDQDRRLP